MGDGGLRPPGGGGRQRTVGGAWMRGRWSVGALLPQEFCVGGRRYPGLWAGGRASGVRPLRVQLGGEDAGSGCRARLVWVLMPLSGAGDGVHPYPPRPLPPSTPLLLGGTCQGWGGRGGHGVSLVTAPGRSGCRGNGGEPGSLGSENGKDGGGDWEMRQPPPQASALLLLGVSQFPSCRAPLPPARTPFLAAGTLHLRVEHTGPRPVSPRSPWRSTSCAAGSLPSHLLS